jgi:copper resistance protein C
LNVKHLVSTAAAFVLLFCGTAQAHTHLEGSTPADQATLASPPAEIELHFSEVTRLTALTIQKEGEKEPKSVDSLPKTASAHVKVPLAPLAPGKYSVNWRAVGGDNHVMSGKLSFTVAKN